MADEKLIRYYKENKEQIELVKKHGDTIARCMARALERLAKRKMEEV